MRILTTTATKPVTALPSLGAAMAPQLSQQAIYGIGVAALAVILFFLLLIYITRKPHKKKAESKVLTPTEIQAKHIQDLKDALVKELRGTSKQNTIMILLTIVFILVTLFGGSVLLAFNKIPGLAIGLAKFLKTISGK